MYCESCGSKIEKKQKFCQLCGMEYEGERTDIETDTNESNDDVDQIYDDTEIIDDSIEDLDDETEDEILDLYDTRSRKPVQADTPNTPNQANTNKKKPRNKKEKKGKGCLFVVLGIIVIFVIIGFILVNAFDLDMIAQEGNGPMAAQGTHRLVDTWSLEIDNNFLYRFYEDGTGVRGGGSWPIESFTWSVDDDLLRISLNQAPYLFGVRNEQWTWRVHNDLLTLDSRQAVLTFTYIRQVAMNDMEDMGW